jgi:hypothetical protein
MKHSDEWLPIAQKFGFMNTTGSDVRDVGRNLHDRNSR